MRGRPPARISPCIVFLPESPITGPETRLRACSPVAPTMTLARGRPELLREEAGVVTQTEITWGD